jgi:sterol desaturase/sphingolipid hydroxylase (fatty acid hydroxylase superfamily)
MPLILWMLAIAFVAYGGLARFFACNPGQRRFFSRGFADDVLYWTITVFFFTGAAEALLRLAAAWLAPDHPALLLTHIHAGYGWAAQLPLPLQALLVFVAFDLMQYWLHRAFHGGALWPFHAIHHSAREVDWTTSFRFHPVNFVLYTGAVTALVRLMGFSDAVFAIVAPINFVIGTLVHANLKWTFGPFRYVVASPVFHRWHHVRDPKGHGANFAPTFPVLDLIFGTFYMPEGELPADYGVDGMPEHFLAQLAHPFVALAGRRAPPAPASQAAS